MKLFYSPNSPYARKCRVVIWEKNLQDRVEWVLVNPLESPAELIAINPLSRVPALITDDGLHLSESAVICEYLDTLSPEPPLFPADARICVMAMAALADGIMDSAVACVMEGRRPPDKQYQEWVVRKEQAILRAIDKFAAIPLAEAPFSLGTINLAVALAYVQFRLPHLAWQAKYPALATWLETMASRPSFKATEPQA